jgi:hypothetical protein
MKKGPNVFTIETLMHVATIAQQNNNGKWIPARPIAAPTLRERVHCAYLAFRGECDLVKWPGGQ